MTDNNHTRARLYYLFRANQHPGGSWLARVPAGLFAIPVGLFGLAGAWRRAGAYGWGIAADIESVLSWSAATILVVALALYGAKAKRCWAAVLRESQHPVQGSLQSLLPLSVLLAVINFGHPDYGIWMAATLAALGLNALIGYRVIAMLATGQMPGNAVTPALYLPVVGGALVGGMAMTTLAYPAWGAVLFGIGLAGWALLEARVLNALFGGPLPEPVRATIGVELAPPAVATLAAAVIWPALPGTALAVGVGISIAPYAGVLARFRWWSEVPFSLGFWSFSFPLAAMSSIVIETLHRGGWPAWIGHVVLLTTSTVIGFLAVRTFILLLQRRLLPAE
jgi:tellurite resistance protein